MSDLDHLRTQIDTIDNQLIELLAQRQEVSEKVGQVKRAQGSEPLVPERWQAVLSERVKNGQAHNLDEAMICQIWEVIHEFSIKQQHAETKDS